MISRASGLKMAVGRFSRPQRGVGVIALPNMRQDTTQVVEVPLCPGVLRLLKTGMAVGVVIDSRCVADGVELTR